MGTILSVARYGEGCWGLVEDLMQKFEEKHGVGKSMSQSVSGIFFCSSGQCNIHNIIVT